MLLFYWLILERLCLSNDHQDLMMLLTKAQFVCLFFADWFCHLVDRWNYFRTVWIRRMCHWGSHLAWLEHQPLGLLIWNSTRDCLPVSHVIHLHELGGAGQIIEKFSDTLQQMCCQHPFLSTPGSTHVTPLKYTPCRAMAYSVCTSCGPFVIWGLENIHFDDVKGLSHPRVRLLHVTWKYVLWFKPLINLLTF